MRIPTDAEQLLGKAWQRGIAGTWSEKALAKGLCLSDTGTGAEELLRDACKDGLHPQAWLPDKITRTAFITAMGSANLKDEASVFKQSSMKQQVRACLFVAGAGLEAQSEKLVTCQMH